VTALSGKEFARVLRGACAEGRSACHEAASSMWLVASGKWFVGGGRAEAVWKPPAPNSHGDAKQYRQSGSRPVRYRHERVGGSFLPCADNLDDRAAF